jgi:outer membrane protein OmpA-like peptidoglycan-associated protein
MNSLSLSKMKFGSYQGERNMLRAVAIAAVFAVVLCTDFAAAQDPKPQYSVKDIQEQFGDCPEQKIKMPDGTCQETRAFGIVRPNADSTPPASPTSKNTKKAHNGDYRHSSQAKAGSRPSSYDLLIGFTNGSSQLTPQSRANARVFADALKTSQLANARVAIDGHTNAVGARDYNLVLSRARAQAVADFLIAQGVESSRVQVSGYGFDRLLQPNNPTSAANRRVEAHRLD